MADKKKRSSSRKKENPAAMLREDCWSDGATEVLIESWAQRYVDLSRGHLRRSHWSEVADAVNSRRRGGAGAGGAPIRRSDAQCKNRIDTVKKRYKAERARIDESGGGAASGWRFYRRLDGLIGPSAPPTAKGPSPSSPPRLALPLSPPSQRRGPSSLPIASAVAVAAASAAAAAAGDARPFDSFYRRTYSAAAAAKDDADDEEDGGGGGGGSGESDSSSWCRRNEKPGGRGRLTTGRMEVEDGVQDLAAAIMSFAEMYERVESSKQRQMMELEKQKMEFTKGLEVRYMQKFVDSLVRIERIKRSKRAADDPGA